MNKGFQALASLIFTQRRLSPRRPILADPEDFKDAFANGRAYDYSISNATPQNNLLTFSSAIQLASSRGPLPLSASTKY